jgi:hypothetical protein
VADAAQMRVDALSKPLPYPFGAFLPWLPSMVKHVLAVEEVAAV